MPERRQAHRREPIIVEVRGEDVEARPLPWPQRNDLGNAIVHEYQEVFNSSLRAFVDPGSVVPRIEMELNDKIKNPDALVKMAYPHLPEDKIVSWDWQELRELLFAALDVNELESLKPLVDPNSLTPTPAGGSGSSGVQRVLDTLRLVSSVDSSSQDSPESQPSTSPMENSSTSSTSETDSSGTNDGGTSPSSSRSQSSDTTS